jgi:hypothetical protein
LSAAVPNDIMLQQRVRVDPAGTYLVAGWVRTRDVEIQQEGGALGANLSVFSLGQSSASVAGSSDWTYVTHVFSAGGLSEVVICARLGGTFSACTGTAWFDDLHVVALEETDLATHAWKETTFLTPARRSGNLLRNGDFETPPIAVAWRWLPHWESRLMEAVPVADFPVRAAELAGAGFRPTTIATNRATTRDQLRIHASWARYLGDPQWQNTDAKRRANAAVILAMFSQFDDSLNLLRDDAYPSARSYLIERLYLAQPGLDRMVDLLRTQAEPSVRYGLLLSMQRMIENDESQTPLTSGVRDVVESLQHDADPGVSSAAAWLCRSSWSSTGEAATVPEGRADGEPDRSRGLPFLQGPAGHRLVRFPAAAREFLMGTVGEPPNRRTETLHVRRINHGFAIAAQEVTVQQYSQFVEDLAGRGIVLRHDISYSPTPDCPQNSVTWYEAAMYCRWLGEQEGLPEDQQCYPRITEIGPDMVLPRDCLRRTGYRLPTEAEWEFACRGGACSTRFFGEATSQLAGYACYAGNSQARTMAVGQLMPNRYGLFDMLGNVWEWCHGAFLEYPVRFRCQTGADDSYTAALFPADGASRQMPPLVYRGGSFTDFVDEVRTAQRVGDSPNERNFTLGFRIARTLID